MGEYRNVWDMSLSDEGLETTDGIKPLMLEQCRNLSRVTGGKVRARFRNVRLHAPIAAVAQVAKSISETTARDDPDDLVDANGLYRPMRFRFDIFNDKYRFRLFDLVMRPVYPVEVSFDEGVFEEIKDDLPLRGANVREGTISVVDDEELMSCFSAAAASNKVTYLIRRLAADSVSDNEHAGDDA